MSGLSDLSDEHLEAYAARHVGTFAGDLAAELLRTRRALQVERNGLAAGPKRLTRVYRVLLERVVGLHGVADRRAEIEGVLTVAADVLAEERLPDEAGWLPIPKTPVALPPHVLLWDTRFLEPRIWPREGGGGRTAVPSNFSHWMPGPSPPPAAMTEEALAEAHQPYRLRFNAEQRQLVAASGDAYLPIIPCGEGLIRLGTDAEVLRLGVNYDPPAAPSYMTIDSGDDMISAVIGTYGPPPPSGQVCNDCDMVVRDGGRCGCALGFRNLLPPEDGVAPDDGEA